MSITLALISTKHDAMCPLRLPQQRLFRIATSAISIVLAVPCGTTPVAVGSVAAAAENYCLEIGDLSTEQGCGSCHIGCGRCVFCRAPESVAADNIIDNSSSSITLPVTASSSSQIVPQSNTATSSISTKPTASASQPTTALNRPQAHRHQPRTCRLHRLRPAPRRRTISRHF